MTAGLRASNARLRALVAELQAENGELRAQLAGQAEKIARLERLVSRNSGNSSMPPSGDDQPGRKRPPRKAGGGGNRRPGGQPGAPGAFLAWNQDPDQRIGHFPQGSCACGADLDAARDLGVRYSHQVTDLPEVRAQTLQHDRHAVRCGCGREHVAAAPPGTGAPGTAAYGLNFQAWCVFLLVMHHVPVQRCADIIESMSGTRPSDGWVHSLLRRAAAAVTAACEMIRALIIAARVICGDETPVRAGPGPLWNKKYLHVACTQLLTCYYLGGRDAASFTGFVYPDLDGTVLVHDRYHIYDTFTQVSHQLCCAHLLRDLEDAAQTYPAATWPARAATALRALIHAANLARTQDLDRVPAAMTTRALRQFRHSITTGLAQIPRLPGARRKQPPARLLLECLKDREADVLRFLTSTAIPPTSNQAERDLRPAKTQQKISGRLRSEQATRDRYAIRGYASTASKHGQPIFTAIRDALTGNPWTPPTPAGT